MAHRSHMLHEDLMVIDRRRTERIEAEMYAHIFADGIYIADCIIRNMSGEGMAISYSSEIQLPDKFEIKSEYFEDTIPVRKVWSKRGMSGLEVHM